MIRVYYLMRHLTRNFINPGLTLIPYLHKELVTKNIIVKRMSENHE